MLIVILVRVAIWLTFLLLTAEGIAAIVWARRFSRNYVIRHKELEVRIDSLERRMQLTEKQS